MFTKNGRGDPRKRRRGFTLVELLVVITIIGMLMAMMFPALGSVLDVVRLNGCQNNLSSLGKAIATAQTAGGGAWPVTSSKAVTADPGAAATESAIRQQSNKRPPARRPGTRAAAEKPKSTGFSWIVTLLSRIDQVTMYNQIEIKSKRFSLSPFDPSLTDDKGVHFSQTVLKVAQCPVAGTTGSTAPEYNDFVQRLTDPVAQGLPVAVTNYVALSATHLALVMGTDPEGRGPNGVMHYFNKPYLKVIPDGDSNTLVLAETREADYSSWFDGTTSWVVAHDPNTPQPAGNGKKWTCEGGCQHSLNIGPDRSIDESNITYYRQAGSEGKAGWGGRKPWSYGPSSLHNGGLVNHMYGDKRVQALQASGPNQINANLYMQLVTRDGGESATPPD